MPHLVHQHRAHRHRDDAARHQRERREQCGVLDLLGDELRWRALGAAAGHHPREHFRSIRLAPQEDRSGFVRPRVRQQRRADGHTQRPYEHARHGQPQVAASERRNHEGKTGEAIEQWHGKRHVNGPRRGVGRKRGKDDGYAGKVSDLAK